MLILISISTIPIGTTVPTATDFSQQRAESTVLSDDILTLAVLAVVLGSPVGEGGRVWGYHPAVERCRRSSATAASVSEAEPAEAMVSIRCRVLRGGRGGQVRRGDWVSSRHDALLAVTDPAQVPGCVCEKRILRCYSSRQIARRREACAWSSLGHVRWSMQLLLFVMME